MVHITITPEVASLGKVSSAIELLGPTLQAEFDLAGATASFDCGQDRLRRPVVTLQVRDGLQGEAQAQFAPDELENIPHVQRRLHDLKEAVLRVAEFKQQVNALYEQLAAWSRNLDPPPYLQRTPITISERASGSYEIDQLEIALGNFVMKAAPVAAWVTGPDGRVDLVGPEDREVLVIVDGKWFWNAHQPMAPLMPLTEEVFRRLWEGFRS